MGLITKDATISFTNDNPSLNVFLQMFEEAKIIPRSYKEERKRLIAGKFVIENTTRIPVYLIEIYRIDEVRIVFPNDAIVTLRNPVLLDSYEKNGE